MFELTALALQHDSTRVASIELPAGGLPITVGGEQLSGYHGQSHHGKDPEVVNELVRIEPTPKGRGRSNQHQIQAVG